MTQNSALVLVGRLKELLGCERGTLVEFLLLLGEFDRERLYLDLGYDSLWLFVRDGLGQSQAMTHYRCSAARAVAQFPRIAPLLRDGRLCVTSLARLASDLTEENCDDVLAQA